jgi:hypothetical protein
MKLASIIMLIFVLTGVTFSLHAQSFTIANDSGRNSIDISGSFNGAEVNLPAVKKLPQFNGGKKAWQEFLRSNINIKVPFVNKAVPGIYKVMIRYIVGSNGKLSGIGADSNCGYGMESEVIRCINKSPDWTPAETSSGDKVSFTLRTIVIFTVKPNDVIISFY